MINMFKNDLAYQPFGKKYKLTSRLSYRTTEGVIYNIPLGFATDLTTYYFEGKWTAAAVLHDYLLSLGTDRDIADAHMRKAMRSLKVDWFNYMVISVGIFIGNKALKLKNRIKQ